jgi:ABC-type cobalamin/Fe3+-siderophores transport system ATPase subunit
MSNIYSKGSEWRRWEPHIHTPGTVKNDNFNGADLADKWDKFINDINVYADEISVIAITDYLSSDNYFKFKKAIEEGKITRDFKLVLPNIELRISPVTGGSTPINIHCIFNPLFDSKLNDRFYSKLKFHYQTRDYLATKNELIELGRKYKNTPLLDEEIAYKEGIKIFVPSIDHLKKVFDEDAELRLNCIVVVSNKSNDGVSGLNAHAELLEGEKHNILDGTRQTIYYLSDGVFSSNQKDIDYFLGLGVDSIDKVKRKCRNLKPCLHGCDAHENSKIFEPDQKRYCWIKADPTFEGLRQIIFEPFSRIRIQQDKPEQKRPHLFIDKVKFITPGSDLTFSNEVIEINSNLNSIIGGKSSGKSLLLYYIAKTIDPQQLDVKYSDLDVSDRYPFETEITGFDFEVIWGDGISYKISDPQESKNRQITYIPQMYINHLAEKRGNDELKKLIQSILEEKPDFLEFYTASKDEISRLKVSIANNIYQYFEQEKKLVANQNQIKGKGDKAARQQNLEKRLEELAALRIEAGFNEEEEKDYTKQLNNKTLHDNRRRNLETLKDVILNDYSTEMQRIEEEVKKSIKKLTDNTASKFVGTEKIQKAYIDKVNQYEKNLLASFENIYVDIVSKVEKIDRCIQKSADKIAIYDLALTPYLNKITKKEKLEEIQNDITQEESTFTQIKELEQQESVLIKQMSDYKNEVFVDYEKMMKKYQAVIEEINTKYSDINTDKKIKLKAALSFDTQSFFNNCTRNINKQTALAAFGSYFNYNNFVFTESSHLTNLKSFFEKILSEDIKYNQGGNQSVVCSSMFDDYFIIDFEIYEKEESIFRMSPGKKGLILLYLILHLSNASYPILIDQPEDNLDNRTVYKELKDFMKTKKIERQVIIVTHNANLVVPTDSENIIVANQSGQDKGKENETYQFEYISGSLENSFIDDSVPGILNQMGIREHVCEILEGGEDAFKEREIRYSIS